MPPSVGTAGWTLPRIWQADFPPNGSHLERYAAIFPAAEINSSFYRQHRRRVYERWRSAVPASFRFSVKLPRAITHDQRLVAADVMLEVFLEEVTGLGGCLGPLLVQLPPSLAFEREHVEEFLHSLRAMHGGAIVCEPRHASWFEPVAEALLDRFRVARVAADPACVPAAATPGGWPGLAYYRLHGSPHMYRSTYTEEDIERLAAGFRAIEALSIPCWYVFDNTTLAGATGNALALQRRLASSV